VGGRAPPAQEGGGGLPRSAGREYTVFTVAMRGNSQLRDQTQARARSEHQSQLLITSYNYGKKQGSNKDISSRPADGTRTSSLQLLLSELSALCSLLPTKHQGPFPQIIGVVCGVRRVPQQRLGAVAWSSNAALLPPGPPRGPLSRTRPGVDLRTKQGAKYQIFLASTCGAGGWPSKRGDGDQVFVE
jgi:hypothetical protein